MSTKNEVITRVIMMVAVTMVMFFPGLVSAGSLEPTAAPGSTMKTLDQIPPAWSQKLQCDTTACPRFQLVLDGAAVLDKETGLVWEKDLSTTQVAWATALDRCAEKEVGGRKGWHLPTVEQLTSLMDTSVAGSLKLPTGHTFTGVLMSPYWSATTYAFLTDRAWYVYFFNASVGVVDKAGGGYVWCVRGGQSHDAY